MNEIEQKIAELIASKIKMNDHPIISSDDWDKPLTGSSIQLSAVDLVYLLFEVEKAFGIHIEAHHLKDYGFSTIHKIAKIIQSI